MSVYPCLDEYRRYRSFPCAQCTAPKCWMGKKPVSAQAVKLHAGQRACAHCSRPFHATGRNRYCSESCRHNEMLARRRRRRVASVFA